MKTSITVCGLRKRVAAWSLTILLLVGLMLVASACQPTAAVPDVEPIPVRRPEGSLRVASLNVLRWCMADDVRRQRMAHWLTVQRPDVVALQELNGCSEESLRISAGQWGHEYTAFLDNQGDPLGLTSSAPITDVVMTREGFFYGLLEGQTHGLRFFVVHLHPWSRESRQQEMALLLEKVEKARAAGAEVVVIGDFNALSPSDSQLHANGQLRSETALADLWVGIDNMRDGELDYSVMERMDNGQLVDLTRVFQPEARQRVSYPTPLEGKRGQELRDSQRRLDYVFVSPALAERTVWAGVVIDDSTHWLSDHYPLIADFGGRQRVPTRPLANVRSPQEAGR